MEINELIQTELAIIYIQNSLRFSIEDNHFSLLQLYLINNLFQKSSRTTRNQWFKEMCDWRMVIAFYNLDED